MREPSRNTRLAQHLMLLAAVLRVVNEIIELLSKVVNYGRPLRELRV